jgi:hypothetical protein
MNKLLIGIAQRLIHKAIKVNTEEYSIKVSVGFVCGCNSVTVVIFDGCQNDNIFCFYDYNPHKQKHISLFRYILRKIRKRGYYE